jgi:transglutaminase-like putative cysteine protease
VWDWGRPTPGTAIELIYEAEVLLGQIEWEVDADQAGVLGEIPMVIAKEYLADRETYTLQNPLIVQAAREASGDSQNPLAILRGVVKTVHQRLVYKMDRVKNDAATTLLQGQGSCTEYAFAMIALARRNGLPARYVSGLNVRQADPGGAKPRSSYHKIVEFYLPRTGWLPVDTTKASLKFDNPKGKITGRLNRTMLYFAHEPEADTAPIDPRQQLFTATSGEPNSALQMKKHSTITWDKR